MLLQRLKRYILARLDPSEDRRNAEHVIAFVAAAGPATIVVSLWYLIGLGSVAAGLAMIALGAGIVGILALVRVTGHVRLAAHLLAASCVAIVCILATLRGGFHVQLLMWLALIPICGNLLASFRAVIGWSIVCVAVFAVFYMLAATDRLPDRLNLGADREMFVQFGALVLFIVITSLVSIPIGVARIRLLEEKNVIESELVQAQKLDGLGQLAGGIAHDFGNVLMVIQNAALDLDNLPAGHPQRRAVEDLAAACERAVGLTKQLRIFARHDRVHPKILDVGARVWTTAKLLDRALGGQVCVELSLADALPPVEIDPQQFDQVMMNLILNARDAMPEGGPIRVRAENVQLDRSATEPALAPGPYVKFSITDSGTGVPEDIQDRVFDPFFTTKEEGVGTGLGLATCYGIVKRAGGHISLESSPEGTTFHVLFPASSKRAASRSRRLPTTPVAELGPEPVGSNRPASNPPASNPNPPAVSTPEPEARIAHILLVEDEIHVRKVVERTLTRQGYSVSSAENGRAAIEILESGPDIDLVLTDVVMPEMSGSELAEELERRDAGLKVTFMSGYTGKVHGSRFPDDAVVLEKPFTRKQLLAHIERALGDTP